MTITDRDQEDYLTTVDDFYDQPMPDDCLPTCIKNILSEYSDRKGVPEIDYSLSTINNICDYQRGVGTKTNVAGPRMADRLEQHGYTIKYAIRVEMSELEGILENADASYPIVELDPNYFDEIEGMDFRKGRDGTYFSHTVIIFKMNSNRVLYYDPFSAIMERSSKVEEAKRELSVTKFYELWNGRHMSRWTLWAEERPSQQARLGELGGED